MQRSISAAFAAIGLAVLVSSGARADDATEARLREALRSATTQLRQLQDDQAAMQAKQSELEKQNQALQQQLAAQKPGGGGKGGADRAALDQAVAEFNRKLGEQNQTITRMDQTLDKWKAAYNEAVTVARAKEAERAKLAGKVEGLDKAASGCADKNAALYKIGIEILDRYAHMDLGDALGAREPFIGIERVKLQNIVQDYHDKLDDRKVEQKVTE